MGLFSQCPARRFLDDASTNSINQESRILLSNFFGVMRAQNVHLRSGMPRWVGAYVDAASGIPLSEHSRADAPAPSHSEIRVLPIREAVVECCSKMTRAPQLPSVSGGISFGLDRDPNGPRNSWTLALHRGPLPLLELGISDGTGFKPPSGWDEMLFTNGGAHVLWVVGTGYIGRADHIYLLLKRKQLFQWSKGDCSSSAVRAGGELRRLCEAAWEKGSHAKTNPFRLSTWRWRQRRFVREFDRRLLARVERDQIAGILSAMGTNIDNWLRAVA